MLVRRLRIALLVPVLLVMATGIASSWVQPGPAGAIARFRPPLVGATRQADSTPRLHGSLEQLATAASEGDHRALRQAAVQHNLAIHGNKVLVVIEGQASHLVSPLTALGGEIDSVGSDRLSLLAPISSLRAMAEVDGVRYVRPPLAAIRLEAPQGRAITGQGVALLGADRWHKVGFTGRGVRAAVIDFGFFDWPALRDRGELPENTVCINHTTQDNCGSAIPEHNHGSACAEILADMAPGVEALYLYTFDDDADLARIVDHMVQTRVDVASLSIGWLNGEPNDGSGPVSLQTNRAQKLGDIFWATAAGNHRLRHWEGTFLDSDGDGLHEFDEMGSNLNVLAFDGDYREISGHFTAALTWNDWPWTSQDYDLHLLRLVGTTWRAYGGSTLIQDGDDPPAELLHADLAPGVYALLIEAPHQDGKPEYLELFTLHTRLDARHRVESSSILEPATADGSIAVAAFPFDAPAALEAYSSMGPRNPEGGGPFEPSTCGEKLNPSCKPDFAGPDWVSTASYLPSALGGTSAAAPHIAGAAALVRSAHPSWSSQAVYAYLRDRAEAPGPLPDEAGPLASKRKQDPAWGWGRLHLGDPPGDSAVTVDRFAAVPQGPIIRVEWETSTEINNQGFNLYRGELAGTEIVSVNAALIPSHSLSPPDGATYSWTDASIIPGQTYLYSLEVVGNDGKKTHHGPVRATADPGPFYHLSFPLSLAP